MGGRPPVTHSTRKLHMPGSRWASGCLAPRHPALRADVRGAAGLSGLIFDPGGSRAPLTNRKRPLRHGVAGPRWQHGGGWARHHEPGCTLTSRCGLTSHVRADIGQDFRYSQQIRVKVEADRHVRTCVNWRGLEAHRPAGRLHPHLGQALAARCSHVLPVASKGGASSRILSSSQSAVESALSTTSGG